MGVFCDAEDRPVEEGNGRLRWEGYFAPFAVVLVIVFVGLPEHGQEVLSFHCHFMPFPHRELLLEVLTALGCLVFAATGACAEGSARAA